MIPVPKKRTKVYLSGKITGLKYEDAFELFDRAEKMFEEHYDVVNPMKLRHDHDQTWVSYMKEDIKAMMDCSMICLLHNWQDSEGARIEKELAEKLKMNFTFMAVA